MSDVEAAQPTTPATQDAPDPAARMTLARRSRERHPSPQEYVRIALILGAITGGEIAVYYMHSLRSILIPLLLTFAAIKFTLVVMWFMHLKFDNRLYARFFLSGLLFALSIYAIVLLTFRVFAN